MPADPGGPSHLLQAFTRYLRARPTEVESGFEGVVRGTSELGSVPSITLEPQVGPPDRTVLYFHGGGYVSGSPPE
jgi:acetyl esterase/lipase